MSCAEDKWRAHALAKLEGQPAPDDPACLHRPLVGHHTWFHRVSDHSHTAAQPCPRYLAAGVPAEHQRALALLRTGSFPVRANIGRHLGLPFASRVCQRCELGCVDTEPHCLLECPALGSIRARFAMLDFHQPLHAFLAHTTSKPSPIFDDADTLRPVARFVHAVHSHLLELQAPPQPPPAPPAPPQPVARVVPRIPRPPLPPGYNHYVPDAAFRAFRVSRDTTT
jgi:hypothetical protein